MIEEEKGEGYEVKGHNSGKVDSNIDVCPGKVLHHVCVVLDVDLVDLVVEVKQVSPDDQCG